MDADVAALFVRADSVYKTLAGVDAWDIERDARNWPGGVPVVAHPPCRAWGQLRTFAKPREDERALAPWAIEQLRRFGGVLEHPAKSQLWPELGLPAPGAGRDKWGGWTLGIHQGEFGHRAEKRTLLYIVGADPAALPAMPMSLDYATHVIGGFSRVGEPGGRPEITKAEREHTPPPLARWLVAVARLCAQGRPI